MSFYFTLQNMFAIAKRRNIIGSPVDMAVYVAQLLERPDGKRAIARRALSTGFRTDPETCSGLCDDPDDNLYIPELIQICRLLDISITNKMAKIEIIKCLRNYVMEADTCLNNMPEDTPLEQSEWLFWKANINKVSNKISSSSHALCLSDDGTIRTWGDNRNGQCNIPINQKFITVSAERNYSAGISENGKILVWGDSWWYGNMRELELDKKFIAVSVGGFHSLGLLEDGTVYGWGANVCGQRVPPKTNKKFISVSVGGFHSLGLLENGEILAWGDNQYGQCNVPLVDKRFIAISADYGYSVGLLEDGTVLAWGLNAYNKCQIPKTNKKFIAISAGDSHVLGLLENGKILAWGSNKFDQCNIPQTNKKFVAISAGEISLGLLEDGEVLAWGVGTENFKI